MNSTISRFMGVAITVVVIVALVFGVLYTSVKDTTTGSDSYKTTVDNAHIPTTSTTWVE